VAFDGPAHGMSPGRRTDVISFSSCVRDVARLAGPFYAIIGHSFGGATIVQAVQEHGVEVERLVLLGSPSHLPYVLNQFREMVALPDNVYDHFLRHLERRMGQHPESFDIAEYAGVLDLPGLIVHCVDDDEILHEQAERTHAAWRGSELLSTQGLGHRRILRDPGVIESVVGFLLRGRER